LPKLLSNIKGYLRHSVISYVKTYELGYLFVWAYSFKLHTVTWVLEKY